MAENSQTAFRFSVIISTRNRASWVERCLASLNLLKDAPSFEVVVVDNASTDATADVVRRMAQATTFPLRYIFEERLGLSVARNRGVAEASGEIVAFIDDDAVADPAWLAALESAYRDEGFSGGGGTVEIDWLGQTPPRWLDRHFLHSLSFYKPDRSGRQEVLDRADNYFIGCNCSFRRAAFLEVGGFDAALGRKGDSLEEGEEVRLQRLLLSNNHRLFYEPKAIVFHAVFPEKLTRSFFIRFYRGKGKTTARSWLREHPERFRAMAHFLLRIPVWLLRSLRWDRGSGWVFYAYLQAVHNAAALRFTALEAEKES